MAIFKLKKFSQPSLDDEYKDWKKSYDSGNKKESSVKAKKWMTRWTKEVYYPNKKKGILIDPDRRIVDDAMGRSPMGGIMLKRKKFGELARSVGNNATDAVVLSESKNLPAIASNSPKPKPKTGVLGGLKNTWKSGGTGKAKIIGGAAALLGGAALLGSRKKDENQN